MRSIQEILKTNLSDFNNNEYAKKIASMDQIFNEIYRECNYSFDKGCGSYLFDGQNYEYNFAMFPKQELLYNLAKDSTSVLEIGSYMGHSILIMLAANPKLHITSIDISNKYIVSGISVLKKYFPEAKIDFYHNDSLGILPHLTNTFDLFHIDGYHTEDYIKQEFDYCKKLVSKEKNVMRVVFDDVSCCESLVKHVANKHLCYKNIRPNCSWTNTYLEISV